MGGDDMMPAMMPKIKSTISDHTAPSARLSADLGSYVFPQHIVATDLLPLAPERTVVIAKLLP